MKKKKRVWVSEQQMLGNESSIEFDKNGKPKPLKMVPITDKGHYETKMVPVTNNDKKHECWDGKKYVSAFVDDFFETTKQRFRIGQSYDEHHASVLKCKKCGGTEFRVAIGSRYAAISCVKCRWEQDIV